MTSKNNEKMWRKCVTVLLVLFNFAGAVYIPRSDLENKPALAVVSGFGCVAVATESKIFIFINDETRRTAGHISLDYRSRKKFLEFKLFSKSELFYCDESQCGLCTYSGSESSCSKIRISKTAKDTLDIRSASVLRDSEHFILCISYLERADYVRMEFLKFVAQDNGDRLPIATAWEPPFMYNPIVIKSFQNENHMYFVVTTTQIFEPDLIMLNKLINNVTTTKVVQICRHDQTEDLASKISILVGCDREYVDIDARGETAFYDSDAKQLNIIMHSKNPKNHTMCRFKLSSIQGKMKETWDECQKKDIRNMEDLEDSCKMHKSLNSMRQKSECIIMTRMTDIFQTQLCTKFGREDVLDNCNLHLLESKTYRNGWLENYDVLQGELMMQIPISEDVGFINDLFMDSNKSYFMSTEEKIVRFTASSSSAFQKLWQIKKSISNKFAITLPTSSKIVYSTSQGVEKKEITCQNLYTSCNDLMNNGWSDPLKCAWCATQQPFYIISQVENDEKCTTLFTDQCPPEVSEIVRFSNRSGISIHGENFEFIKNLTLYVCDIPCHVSARNERTIKCSTSLSEKLSSGCTKLQLSGSIGATKYTLPYEMSRSDSEVQTEEITGNHHEKWSYWKALGGVVAAIVIVSIVALVYIFIKNRNNSTKQGGNSNRIVRIENEYHLENITATRNTDFSPFDDIYVRRFRSLPVGMKIDFSFLHMERNNSLGEGQFGKVYTAKYTDPTTNQTETVACKEMKEGRISEFYEEAQIMAKFHHPNVVRLIGISLDSHNHMPVLIMEYMCNSSLKDYLKNTNNFVVLRDLFSFSIDVAQGMAHLHSINYLHRDLAARNIMLDENLRAKVADFGLCRELNQETQVYNGSNRILPLLWYPPEVSTDMKFTFSADIWSYGVLLWEVFTRGNQPYEGCDTQLILEKLSESEENRLTKPPHCPELVYQNAMMACWRQDPKRRPMFPELVVIMANILKQLEKENKPLLNAGYERVSIPRCTSFRCRTLIDQNMPLLQPFRETSM